MKILNFPNFLSSDLDSTENFTSIIGVSIFFLFFLLKVQGKTKLLAGGRYLKSRWLFCYSDFKIFHFFWIFRLSTIFLIFFDTRMVFSGKFYMENIFLGIFLTKFKTGIAKNQNFGDNNFFYMKLLF